MEKRTPPALTQADLVAADEDTTVREVMQSLTRAHVEELVRWSVAVSRAAYAAGWRDEESLAAWITAQVGQEAS
jgi:hypothetical protein